MNILVERDILDSNSGAAASHVEFLVDGSHILSESINLLVGERLENVLEDVHFIVKRFHLEVTHDDVREILAELVRIYLCQFGSASESAGISPLKGLVDAHVLLNW